MKTFKIKQNDSKPFLSVTVTQDGSAVDLTDVSVVKFYMITADNQRTQAVSGTGAVSNASGGVIKYEWAAGDTDTPGEYWAEFELEWDTGEKQTIPEDDGLKVIITEDYGS